MRRYLKFVALLMLTSAVALAQTAPGKSPAPLPQIKQNGAVKQMFVDGKPFIMLAGELHNSSASSAEYMKPIWDKLATRNVNTVIGTVSWELLEPQENKFDFALVDAQILEARKRNMRLVLIWFASWKNGASSYAPMWVKTRPQRFPLQQLKPRAAGENDGFRMPRVPPLSPLGEASMLADAKAYRALMRHIKEVDPQHTIIMMQVENEMGLLGDSRDRSPLAEAAWAKPVPAELINYFTRNKATLLPEMQEVWGRNGYKISGTWAEVFGKANAIANSQDPKDPRLVDPKDKARAYNELGDNPLSLDAVCHVSDDALAERNQLDLKAICFHNVNSGSVKPA
jgi:hypothetical protein